VQNRTASGRVEARKINSFPQVKTLRNAEGEAMPRREDRDLQPLVRRDEKEDESQNENRGEMYDFLTFMRASGFEEDEVLAVISELDAYKSIPGTTLRRYVNRVQSSVETDCRPAFLKGVIVGTAICENLVVEDGDIDGRIDAEVKRRLREILEDLDKV
jgi:hypothetical protein